ncbi:uncharacterized protein FFMR_04930 [Fusarium fujikuroi]|nr:uncharacterized protein FFMR_04930 [Fusarium fujikuroi]
MDGGTPPEIHRRRDPGPFGRAISIK